MAMAMASSSAAMARLNEHTRVHQKLNKIQLNTKGWRAPYPYCNLTVDVEQPGTVTPRGKPMFPIYTTVRRPGAAPQYIPYRESSRNVQRSQNGHYYQSRYWMSEAKKEGSSTMVGNGPVYDENGRRVRPASAHAGSGSRAHAGHGSGRGRAISRPYMVPQDGESCEEGPSDKGNGADGCGNERSASESKRHGDSTLKRSKSYDLHRRARDKPAGVNSHPHSKLSASNKRAIRTRSKSSSDVSMHHSDVIIKHLDNLSAKLKSGQQRSSRRPRQSSRSHSGGRRRRPSSAGPKREAEDTVEAVIMQRHEQAALEQLSSSVCSKVDSQSSLGSTEGCSLMSSSDEVGEKVIPFKPSAFDGGAHVVGSSRSDSSDHSSDVTAIAPAPSKSPERPVTAMSPGEAINSLRLSTIKEARESIEERSMSSAMEGLFRKSASSQQASASHQTLLNQVSYEEDEEPLPTRRFSPSQRYEAASLIQAFVRGRFTRRRYLLHKAEAESFEESLGNENDMVIVDIGEESEDEEKAASCEEEAKAPASPVRPQRSSCDEGDMEDDKENVSREPNQAVRQRPKSASVYSVGHMYPKNDDKSEIETRNRIAEIQNKWRLGNVLRPNDEDDAAKKAIEKIAIGNISSIASAKTGITGFATVRKDYSEFARRNRSRSSTRPEARPTEAPNNATVKKVSKKAIDAFLDRMKQDFHRRMKAANGGSPPNLSGGEETGRPQSTSGARRRAGTTEAALKRKNKKRPGSAAPRR